MKTVIKKIDKKRIDDAVIQEAGNILKHGGLVAFPTETVYGLGADALDKEAARKVFAAKGRPLDNPLIVHIAKMSSLSRIAAEVPQSALKLAKKFWPGPLTMIFQKTEEVPFSTTGGLQSVAVRMPSDETARRLITAAGGYVAAPSANTSGRPSPTSARHVKEDLFGRIDMILDGGPVKIGVESTILDMTVVPPMILRPGAVTKEMLETVVEKVTADRALFESGKGEKPKAPGMKYRHYAPKAKLAIVEGPLYEEILAIQKLSRLSALKGESVGIIATSETEKYYTCGIVKNLGDRQKGSEIAHNLYAALRQFDEEHVTEIYSESFVLTGIGSAVMDRLEKAAGHVRIDAASVIEKQA